MPAEESEMVRPVESREDVPFDPHLAGRLLDRLRDDRVRVHAITNAAAQSLTANVILAAGGVPSLTVASDEIAAFTASAAALLINLGTLDDERRRAIPRAIATAKLHHKPWILDPVFVNASPARLELARLCLAGGPAVLRCNAAEFEALAGTAAEPDAIMDFARGYGTVVAVTGSTDVVTDGERVVRIGNGHPLMTRVTAMGCAATALVAAMAALHADRVEAAAAALVATGVAGELAAERAQGPGTFEPAFLDALYELDSSTLAARARLS
jgi:hydroxyethylthiazole kinase